MFNTITSSAMQFLNDFNIKLPIDLLKKLLFLPKIELNSESKISIFKLISKVFSVENQK